MPFDLKIIKKSENLTKTSIKSYMDKLKKLNKDFDKNNIKLRQHRRIFNYITRNYPNELTQNGYLSAWKKYLELTGKSKLKIINDISNKIVSNLNERKKKNPILKKEKMKKYKDLKISKMIYDYVVLMDLLISKSNRRNYYKDEKPINIKENFFILGLYLLNNPRRNDYWNCIYINNKEDINDKDNFLLLEKGNTLENDKYTLIFNDYKTAKIYNTQEIEIESCDLKRLIRAMRFNNGERIYKKNKENIYYDLTSITEELFGVKLGINDFRKLRASQPNNVEAIEKILKLCRDMGHSLQVHMDYYVLPFE